MVSVSVKHALGGMLGMVTFRPGVQNIDIVLARRCNIDHIENISYGDAGFGMDINYALTSRVARFNSLNTVYRLRRKS